MDRKKILIITSIALFFTLFSWFFVAEESLMGNNSYNFITRGFPGHFYEYNNAISIGHFLALNFLFDIVIYICAIYAIWYLIDRGLKNHGWWLLVIALALATFWMNLDINQNLQCVAGFPIAFSNKCDDVASITLTFALWGALVDFLFWFSLSSFFVVVLYLLASEKIGKWRYIIAPTFITLMTFWYSTSCRGFICLFEGRGFPLPFYTDNKWSLIIFGIDFLIWAILIYPLGYGFGRFLKKHVNII